MDIEPRIFNNIMGYHMPSAGPYVYHGVFHPGLESCQVEAVGYAARQGHRGELVDLCAERGGDADFDGICDRDDLCPEKFNPFDLSTTDSDRDGVPVGCDLCDTDASVGATGDQDGDGRGGSCDLDPDGDGCPDTTALEPEASETVVHAPKQQGCPPKVSQSRPRLSGMASPPVPTRTIPRGSSPPFVFRISR